MNVLEQFVISLGIDKNGLDKDLKDTNASIKTFVGNAIKAFGALYSINWAKEQLNQFAKVADESVKFARQVNVSVESLGALEEATVRTGGSVEGFRSSLSTLSANISDASLGLGRGKVIFEQLGIEIKDSNGNVRDSLDVFMELNKSLQGLSSAEQIGYARKIGIDNATLRVLQQTPEALQQLVDNQRRLGVVTEEQAQASEAYNDALEDMNQAWRAIVGTFAQSVLPILTKVTQAITAMFVFIRENRVFFLTFFTVFGAILTYALLPAIIAMGTAIMTTLVPSFLAAAAGALAMIAPLLPFIAIGALVAGAIALIVDEFMAWKEGGESVLGFLFDGFAKFGKNIKNVVKDIAKWFGDMWTNIKGGFNTFIGFITGIRDAIAGVFTGVFDGLVSGMEFIKEKLNFILEPLGKIKDALGGFFGGGNAKAVQTTQARSIQNNSNKSNTANIGQINVNLKKGNAKEIANNIAPALKGNFAWGSAGGIQ